MDLVARLVVEGFITGLHRSPYHGFSVEFSEYRPYLPGDPTRHLDWKILGKTERFYVKRFEEETNLKAYLVVDASASMGYASGGTSKLEYASMLAAALTYLMLLQRDAVGLLTFDTAVRTFLPPRSVLSTFHAVLPVLDRLRPEGETDLARIFHDLAERIKRRGLIVVFSDLMDEPAPVLNALKHFRHQKHEVIVFHILDPMERTLSFDSDAVFVDLESGERLHTDPRQIQADYRDSMENFIGRIRKECRNSGIDYETIVTDQPFDTALFRYLSKRKRVGG
jgi:uncharacterized protein (DUF58 family)